MPDLPPQLPEAPQAPQQNWPAVIAWIAIVLAVTFVMRRVSASYEAAAKAGVPNPAEEIQVSFAGRAAVGMKSILPASGAASQPSVPAAGQMFINALDRYAISPPEKLKVITVAGELLGSEAALERLDRFQSDRPGDDLDADAQSLQTIYRVGADQLTEDAQQRLIARYGFFGRLAASYEKPQNDPNRAAVMSEARSAAVRTIVLEVLVLILLGIIAISALTAIILAALGYFHRAYVSQRSMNSAYLEAFAIYLVGFILLGRLLRALPLNSLAWEWVALILLPIAMLWVQWRGVAEAESCQGFGWHRGRGPLIEIPMGLFGYFAGIPVVLAGASISYFLMKRAGASPMHPIQQMLRGNRWQIINLYGLACVFAPLIEEAMFRGALFNHLRRGWNWIISASIVAFIFAAIHPQGWTAIPALGSIAIVLAAIREWRGSIIAPITAHACNNFIVLSLALLVAR